MQELVLVDVLDEVGSLLVEEADGARDVQLLEVRAMHSMGGSSEWTAASLWHFPLLRVE